MFILDCTGCQQFDEKIARPQGTPRTEAQWAEAVTRMLGYAGATTSFPVIAAEAGERRGERDPHTGGESANPRAIDLDASGRTWVVLGQPKKLAAVVADTHWRSWDVGMYPHSLAMAPDGKVWFNGRFTREPELIGFVDPAGDQVTTYPVPPHPTLAKGPARHGRGGHPAAVRSRLRPIRHFPAAEQGRAGAPCSDVDRRPDCRTA